MVYSLLTGILWVVPLLSAVSVSHALCERNGIDATGSEIQGQTALYWGQASAKDQGPLRYYCDCDSVDIFLLSFLMDFPHSDQSKYGYELNLANACTWTDKSSKEKSQSTPNCTTVGDDIKYCQSLNKTVLLSLGGEQGNYGFEDEQEAVEFAKILWDSFGGGDGLPKSERPFGDAVVDGFDFDLERDDQTGYLALAHKLKEYTDEDLSKEYFFTAAPQCTFPDVSTSELIDGFELDKIFVQFYNNDCHLNEDEEFNFDTWAGHIQSLDYNKTKLFLGLPANSKSAVKGFAKKEKVVEKIKEIWKRQWTRDLFGGVMFWDASQGFGYGDVNKFQENLITDVSGIFQKENPKDTTSGVTVTDENPSSNSSDLEPAKNESISESIDGSDIVFIIVALFITSFIIGIP